MKSLILASQSPRRKKLLEILLGRNGFSCIPSQSEETFPEGEIDEALLKVAKTKGLEVFANHPDALVLSADTIVVDDGRILGKPKSLEEAFETLQGLSGKKHLVKTGIVLLGASEPREKVVTSEVFFKDLSYQQIMDYVQQKSCLDKAGSYGIQDTDFVDHIKGSYSNIVGLPIMDVQEWLQEEGFDCN